MRRALFIFGFIVTAVAVFIVGLVPGERTLSSPGADSYILIGIARFAVQLTALCEFLLGAAVAALWMTLWVRFSKPSE
jgi:hypothetical protein